MKNLTLGCDPECFIVNLQGELVSSIGKIGGSKLNPMPLPLGDGFAVQEDNVALEFNIPPAHNSLEFFESISTCMDFLDRMVCGSQGMQLTNLSAVSFPEAQLQDEAAKQFGCDPDYNAWTGARNPRPKAQDPNLRSCGGHVHIGWDREQTDVRSVMRMMDLHLGVPSVLMDHGELRKELYGKAGAYRETSFGGEYRTLSNFWIFERRLITWVWNNTERAVDAAVERLALSNDDEARIVSAINDNNKELAQELVNKFSLELVNV